MTRSLAVEWARHKVRVNAIAPGPFPTEGAFSRLVPPDVGDAVQRKVPLGRYGRHDELANLAAYLCADGSGYITGECVTIDGGEQLLSPGFNGYTQFDQSALAQLFDAMRDRPKS
jgi:NAD(P)-dependent dehydrogenase (short-subunit alcohol dehydrogenase family)